jgi:hypothetical protein
MRRYIALNAVIFPAKDASLILIIWHLLLKINSLSLNSNVISTPKIHCNQCKTASSTA